MAILVTGAAGFLGRHAVRHLLGAECAPLVVLDVDVESSDLAATDRMVTIEGDVVDLDLLIDVVERSGVDAIVHLAYVLESSHRGLRTQIEANVMGSMNVFEAARLCGVRRVVYTSSALVYPHRWTREGYRYSERDATGPDGVYGACKVLDEQVAAYYANSHGLDSIGLRFTAVFGPGRGDRGVAPDHNVLPELALRGERVVMPPDDQLSDWMYVKDAAEVIRLALRAPGSTHRVLNVASECRPVGEATALLREILPEADIGVSDEPFVMTSLMRTDRLRQELGFVPRYTLESGLIDYLGAVRTSIS